MRSLTFLLMVWKSTVKLLGMVINKAEIVTYVSFEIDDGTGRIDCTKWVNEYADMKEIEGIHDGMYVCVHGHLEGFQGNKQLVVFAIRPVADYNEITYHFVECTYVHFYNTKLRVQGGGPVAGHIPTPAASTPFQGYQATPSNQFTGMSYSTSGVGGIEKMVIDYLQQPSCMQSLELLQGEGLVYSSIDEFHFKAT